jgi:hypothetical protein
VTIAQAAKSLNMAPSTLHRWLADGFIAGEQITPPGSALAHPHQ